MLQYDANTAIRHLQARDRRLGTLIARVGPLGIHQRSFHTPFHALYSAILSQQLSSKAARHIYQRTRALFPGGRVTAPAVLRTPPEQLRSAGLSRAKVAAVRDLAAKYAGRVIPNAGRLRTLDDETVIEQLIQVRGVGRWTAQMLLMFYLGRPDVLPVDDLGVRKGFQKLYRRGELPTKDQLSRHGERWRPYRSAASWYLWRATEL